MAHIVDEEYIYMSKTSTGRAGTTLSGIEFRLKNIKKAKDAKAAADAKLNGQANKATSFFTRLPAPKQSAEVMFPQDCHSDDSF
jgi:hypothetical protein